MMKRRYLTMAYVYPRPNGFFEIRYPIPEDVRSYFPKSKRLGFRGHVVVSLGTKDKAEAGRLAQVKFADLELKFSMLRDGAKAPEFGAFFRSVFAQELERGRRRRAESTLSGQELDRELAVLRRVLEQPEPGELKAVAGWVVDWYFLEMGGAGVEVPSDTALWDALLIAAAEVLLDVYMHLAAEFKGMAVVPTPQSPIFSQRADSVPEAGESIPYTSEGRMALAVYWRLYAQEKQGSGSPITLRTLKRRETAWRELTEFLGAATPLFKVMKADVYRYRSALQKAPRYGGSTADLRDLDFKQRIALAEAEPGKFANLDNGSIDDRIRQINAVFQLAVDRGYIDRNPVKGVPQTSVSTDSPRDIYSIEELQLIFSSEPYYGRSVSLQDQTDEFWVPLMELFMGTRANENYLRVQDVIDEQAVPHLEIVPFSGRPLKNKSSRRRMPIHPQLIELGFLDYCKQVRSSGEQMLFPSWQFREGGTASEAPARRRFNKHLKRLLPERSSRTDSHTFRHNFETALSGTSGVSERVMLRLSGRTIGGTAAGYLKDKGILPELSDAISKVRYPGLSLNHLV